MIVRQFRRIFIVVAILVVAVFGFHTTAKAAISGAAGFSVEPTTGAQPTASKDDFFTVSAQSGQSYPLTMKITNNHKYPIKVVVVPTVAGTTSQGQLNYSNLSHKVDSSLKYNWTKMGPTKKTIKIQPKQSQDVVENVQVNAPKLNGAMLGSFYIYSPTVNNKAAKKSASKSGMHLNNVYSYAVSVLFKVGNFDEAQPDLRLVRVKPALLANNPAVFINLQNFEPKYITNNDMQVDAKIYPANSNKLLFRSNQKQMNFAPNSNFDFPISWGNEPMKAGNYQARVHVKTSARSWNFKKNFTISPEDANRLNRQNPAVKKNYWPLIIIIVIILIILIGILFYWFYRKGQKKASK
ncbi:DUF3324 domain-containing protein [Bombilactobacillus thymidiniphilus]|uniref:DUF916 and DUF3324 domain-containing protein n=1 Tax=Bombilactobacillus thymidiniphilus TaxID=2923363 RepID=A0ABY4PBR9_9LACO|nr:DUF3324 domain-containing protein [Bombilactobacillus thymidiniphilus]UQS83218.1 DUF916 and DUF3324 domain-containing protein [Bombilactobacillus thymidiniphilus]